MFALKEYDFPPYIEVKRSARAKRLALRLDPKDRIFHLIVPQSTSMRRASRFAEEHDYWMREKLAELPQAVMFVHDAEFCVMGQLRRVKISSDNSLKSTRITLNNKEIMVSTNLENPSSRIERFLKKMAKVELTRLAHEKAAMINKTINAVTVRDTKSRWGSCSCDGNLSFSWRLIFAPYESFDYVVAHEVAHLVHLNHSKAFWAQCRSLSDDFVEGEYWMREHGHELMRYGSKGME